MRYNGPDIPWVDGLLVDKVVHKRQLSFCVSIDAPIGCMSQMFYTYVF